MRETFPQPWRQAKERLKHALRWEDFPLPCHKSHGIARQDQADCARFGRVLQRIADSELEEVEASG